MNFVKALFYTAVGSLMTIFYRDGMEVAMSWMFIIWLPFAAHDLGETITPYQTKKTTGAGDTDSQQK
ncbi:MULTISPECIES: hypothetical protein [Limosilactobacillus]|uniref:hypothetical protein n=1 Tax=Limosilactobacillus TaxID=2742598 RepID=UPI00242A89F4|nr:MULTISPECIES: hypothetical protein [Limosilactobacillus]MCI6852631.1 hypothetical protein [Limosilactobacillus vaginalis]MDY4864859.1 hypothetical protein [Limosilactobacillus sp.]